MKEWLSEPQNISPLFPLPCNNLLSEVLPIHLGNADWWQKSLKVRASKLESRVLVTVYRPFCSPSSCSLGYYLAKKTRKRRHGSRGRHCSVECAGAVL